ncbi:hypothetical protein LTR56_014348 [Elasticomyces elasticus]|nr:hypothetical protein LTR56_014348 [Elasticomyces elasticus]KAK3636364.1 hypothetical protein LTR22_018740 [Elasticomyces elasticus]KAK4916604.1 hypothetical protein LTR49_015437 [Elasticomyces elasticus]KAK5756159.1 hypothetical protein LTS12_013712 [Elasticomyces elasticus]
MGAAPSIIADHELTPAADVLGDVFPSGSSFYLTNGASGYKECLAVDLQGKASLKTIRDSPDRKWIVECYGTDRSKIALRNVGTGTWLAIKDATYGNITFLHSAAVYHFVYKGAEPNTFWLSTTHLNDCFLCFLPDVPGASPKDIRNLTSSHGAGYGKGAELYRGKAAELSWRLEWTPEYEKVKAQTPEGQAAIQRRKNQIAEKSSVNGDKGEAGTQQQDHQGMEKALGKQEEGVCCANGEKCKYKQRFDDMDDIMREYEDLQAALADIDAKKAALVKEAEDQKKSQAALNAQVKAHAEKEAAAQKRADALAERERAVAEKEDAVKQKEIDLQKRDQDLDARLEGVIADEKASKATRVDKETARKKREEQAAHTEEVQRKNEVARKERQAAQAEAAKLKAENAELRAKVRKFEEELRDARGRDGEDTATHYEKARLQADLEHAQEIIGQLQQQNTEMSQRNGSSVVVATPASYGFSIPPPAAKMPTQAIPHSIQMPSFGSAPPNGKLPSQMAFGVAPPQRTRVPTSLGSR